MEEAPRTSNGFLTQPAFDVDLQPMYALTEPQYQAVINQLSNLVVGVIQHFRQTEQGEMAQQVAQQAHAILRAYDDDMAEKMQWVARSPAPDLPPFGGAQRQI